MGNLLNKKRVFLAIFIRRKKMSNDNNVKFADAFADLKSQSLKSSEASRCVN